VNGVEIGSAANMFVAHRFDATGAIQEGRNVVAVRLDSTVATV